MADPNESCAAVSPLLYRVAEGEASPEEAMRTARHLSDCTACRILLARERRLAAMLEEGLEDPLQVGEDFVRAVMETLPVGPPPPRRRKNRRVLKLACLAGLLGLLPSFAALHGGGGISGIPVGSRVAGPALPFPDGAAESLQQLGGLLLLALDRLAVGLSWSSGVALTTRVPWLVLAPLALCGALATAAVLALFVRGALASRRADSPRVG